MEHMDDLSGGEIGRFSNGVAPVNYGNDAGLHVEFRWVAKHMKAKSESEGRPVFERVAYCKIVLPGRLNIVDRPVTEIDKHRFSAIWQRFLAGAERPQEGTPLEEWPALMVEQVASLKAAGIHSIEQLANVPENAFHSIGMGARELQTKAKAFIENAKSSAHAQKLAAENENLRSEIEILKAQMREISEKISSAEPAPTRRKTVKVEEY